VKVDIGVLCNFVDQLCVAFIVEKRHQQMALLHDITLPRSWFLTFPFFSAPVGHRDTQQLGTLVNMLRELLSQLYGNQDAGPSQHKDL
jgi:hypothetical protein